MSVARQHIHIGGAQGAQQHLVTHRASVHEQELCNRRAARIGRQRRIACQMKAFALGVNAQGVFGKILAQYAAQPPMQGVKQIAGFGVGAEHGAIVALGCVAQNKGDKGFRHRQPFNHICHGLRLCPVCAQKLQSRGCGVKHIAQFNHGT